MLPKPLSTLSPQLHHPYNDQGFLTHRILLRCHQILRKFQCMVLFHLKFLLSILSWEPKNQWDLRDLEPPKS